jgi:hypothetical protein
MASMLLLKPLQPSKLRRQCEHLNLVLHRISRTWTLTCVGVECRIRATSEILVAMADIFESIHVGKSGAGCFEWFA